LKGYGDGMLFTRRYVRGLGATPEELQAQMAAMTIEINDLINQKASVDAQIKDLETKITAATGTAPASTPGVDPVLLEPGVPGVTTEMYMIAGMPWYIPIGAGAVGILLLTKLLRR